MIAYHMTEVVTELIFVLIAEVGKECNRRSELIIAVSLEAGDSQGGRTEWERQRKAEIGISGLREMEQAGVENKSTQPVRIEGIGITEGHIPIVVMRQESVEGNVACCTSALCVV